MQPVQSLSPQFLSAAALSRQLGISTPTLFKMLRDPEFPRPGRASPRGRWYFDRAAVAAYLAAQHAPQEDHA